MRTDFLSDVRPFGLDGREAGDLRRVAGIRRRLVEAFRRERRDGTGDGRVQAPLRVGESFDKNRIR
jgi:hypothetical protein